MTTITEGMVEAAAKVIANSPGIDAPKLPFPCWMGLARAALTAALSKLPPAPDREPSVIKMHDALMAANIEYAGYSCNGVNLFGDKRSIDAAMAAFHSHAQIDGLKTQIRHWRDECGKLHGQSPSPPDRNAVIDECAKLAAGFYDNDVGGFRGGPYVRFQDKLASAIRALKTNPGNAA